jgi:hypothetical protein
MRRRFVYDAASERVVEVGTVKVSASAAARYADVSGEYQYQFDRTASDRAAQALRVAALDRADRREFAHKKYGDERRWTE